MTHFSRRHFCVGLAASALPTALPLALNAAPRRYRLDPGASRVGFRFRLGGILQNGTMPVSAADITIDPRNLAASRVDVTLDAARARTKLVYAAQAMTGPDVLDVRRFPTIRFVSSKVQPGPDGRLSGGAQITGPLTVRDVTRPVIMTAALYRQRGKPVNDLSTLRVQLKGAISRKAFGASGFPGLVTDRVELDILAVITTL
ncbi:MAG: YceI family protein [Sedimentitalea sp.]